MTTKREMARLERRIAREREDRERLSQFAEGVRSFTPQSDGTGVEHNPRLRDLDQLNKLSLPEEARERIWHPERDQERRKPGFPSTFGPLAREQAETANEARARFLSPTIDRLAREAAEPDRIADGFPHWIDWVLGAIIVLLAVVLLWAAVEWWMAVRGRP